MTAADLTDAEIDGANFTSADLDRANFTGVKFNSLLLCGVLNLDTVIADPITKSRLTELADEPSGLDTEPLEPA